MQSQNILQKNCFNLTRPLFKKFKYQKTYMKKIIVLFLAVLFVSATFSACSSASKCNGQKKTRTPMGYM